MSSILEQIMIQLPYYNLDPLSMSVVVVGPEDK